MWETSGGQRGRQGYGMRETDIHTHRHWNYLASCVDPEPASCRRGGRVMESALTCTQVYKTEWPPAMTMKLLPRKAPPPPPLCSGVLQLPHTLEARGMSLSLLVAVTMCQGS